MTFVEEKNSIWYSTSPNGMRCIGNNSSLDPGREVVMQYANLYNRLLLPLPCKTFIAFTDKVAKFAGLVSMPTLNATFRKEASATNFKFSSSSEDNASSISVGFRDINLHLPLSVSGRFSFLKEASFSVEVEVFFLDLHAGTCKVSSPKQSLRVRLYASSAASTV